MITFTILFVLYIDIIGSYKDTINIYKLLILASLGDEQPQEIEMKRKLRQYSKPQSPDIAHKSANWDEKARHCN